MQLQLRSRRPTPAEAVGKGVLAGVAGTAAMTGYQTAVMKARGQEGGSSTPARVAKRIVEGVLKREFPEEHEETVNNAMHFLYGTTWGAVYGLIHASSRNGAVRDGLAFGTLVWAASLVELPAMKLAPPVWEYGAKEAALDVSYHLVYGLGVAAAYGAIDGG